MAPGSCHQHPTTCACTQSADSQSQTTSFQKSPNRYILYLFRMCARPSSRRRNRRFFCPREKSGVIKKAISWWWWHTAIKAESKDLLESAAVVLLRVCVCTSHSYQKASLARVWLMAASRAICSVSSAGARAGPNKTAGVRKINHVPQPKCPKLQARCARVWFGCRFLRLVHDVMRASSLIHLRVTLPSGGQGHAEFAETHYTALKRKVENKEIFEANDNDFFSNLI